MALYAAAEGEPNHLRVHVDGLIAGPLGAVVMGVPEVHAAGMKSELGMIRVAISLSAEFRPHKPYYRFA